MKRISPGTVTVAVLAIVVGLVAAYVARHAVKETPQPEEVVVVEDALPVVVASVNLTPNHRVRAEDLRIVEVPREQVPDGALGAAEVIQGRVVRDTIPAGTPVLDGQLYPIGVTPTLAEMIPLGQRALTINIDGSAPSAAIVNDSEVDIALTVEDDHPSLGGLATKTLLRGVQVLVGPDASAPSAGTTSMVVSVTPEQANTLITAQRAGTLSVTLCAPHDVATDASDEFIGRNDLLGLAPPPRSRTIERWVGGQLEVIEITESQMIEARQATAADDRRLGRYAPLAISPTPLPPAEEEDAEEAAEAEGN